jgi:hypothetical protein
MNKCVKHPTTACSKALQHYVNIPCICKNAVKVCAQISSTTLCDYKSKKTQQMYAQISTARQCKCMHHNTEQYCIQISNGNIIRNVIFSRVLDASIYFDQCLKSDVRTMISTCCSYKKSTRKFTCKCCCVLRVEQLSKGTF